MQMYLTEPIIKKPQLIILNWQMYTITLYAK